MIRLDTPGAVRAWLGRRPIYRHQHQLEVDTLGRPRPRLAVLASGTETRAHSRLEGLLLATGCSHCGAVRTLCLAETGLPASGPHSARIRAYLESRLS